MHDLGLAQQRELLHQHDVVRAGGAGRVALDLGLRKRPGLPDGAYGEEWEVHGGGFYQTTKFMVAPKEMPEHLTWHKWQAYWTWISGFFLLVWVYYAQSELYLIDPAVMQLSPLAAGAIGILALVFGWLFYDWLCRSPLGRNDVLLGVLGFSYVVAASWAFASVFSGRGALIHTGALHRIDAAEGVNAFAVVAEDGGEALVSYTMLTEQRGYFAEPLRLTGLDPAADYALEVVWPPRLKAEWPLKQGGRFRGAALMQAGFQPPRLHPGTAVILHLKR